MKPPEYMPCAIKSVLLLFLLAFFSCTRGDQPAVDGGRRTIVFKHGKLSGDPAAFQEILRRFEREHPGVTVKDEVLPSSTDEQHQFYVINLEGESAGFDVFSMDVIWVPEFARAGWLRDLSGLLGSEERSLFFPGPMEAVTFDGAVYAVPWYIDAGMLYYRSDLLSKYGFTPPKTWQQLVSMAQTITARERGLYGFVWQGKQYEGLVCNVLEFFWSNGGDVLRDDTVVIDSPENAAALAFMRDLLVKYKVTPPLVTTAIEEPTRHIFGNGRAVFMRNWPYAWNLFQQAGSRVRGRIGITTLPAFPGHAPAAALGGWQLGVNRFSRSPEAAESLVRFLTSPGIQKRMASEIGYKPTRKALYRDPGLLREQPFLADLYKVFMTARPRPVTPYYMMITQVLQPEFSAAVSGIKTPAEALGSAQKQISHILGEEQ
jgi:multiple sugar transport system substrate-binding protein